MKNIVVRSTVSVLSLGLYLLMAIPAARTAPDAPTYQGPRFTGERPAEALNTLKNIEKGLHYAAEKARPAVVTIYVTKNVPRRTFPFRFGPQGDRRQVRGLGSGVIIRENGYILTNYHVVKNVDEIKVLLYSQERVDATIVGTDPSTDLAVLKIDRTNLPELDFANSNSVQVGDWAIAVGSPFSLRNSVSYGHVSALHRSVQATRYENFIQTDAPINRGNSGGPLVNVEGEIIGINTLIQSTSGGSQGIGFASASNLAKRTATDLIKHGEVRRAWLGVSIQTLSSKALQEHFGADHGALVADVKKNSPAEKAGLKSGDLIVALNETTIQNPKTLQQRVIAHDVGDEVTLTVLRDGERTTLSVTLGARPDQQEASSSNVPEDDGLLPRLGLKLGTVSPEAAKRGGLEVDHPVLVVEGLRRGSVAHRAGLRPKDLILLVNRTEITSVDAFEQYLAKRRKAGKDSVLLLIRRGTRNLYVTLPLPDGE